MSETRQTEAERFNKNCFCTTADVPALHRWLENHLRDRGLEQPLVQTHAHLFSASPVFVARSSLTEMRAIITAVEAAVGSSAVRAHLLAGAPPNARVPARARGGLMSYDFHVGDTGPKLIEINTNAGGAMLAAALRRAQRACCAEVEQLAPESPSGESVDEGLWQVFVREWRRARGAMPLGRIAIVDDRPREQYLYPEFLLYARLFESHGVEAMIAAPDELQFRGDSLWHGERRVDLVYNRLTDFYLAEPAHVAVRAAHEADAAVIIPHPQAHALYANKRNLAVLSDPNALAALAVPEDTIRTLTNGIPRTVLVSADDADRWWVERKRWFFKPATGYGSRGSYRGDKLTRKTFREIIAGDYVAQAVVPPEERRTASAPEQRSLKVDLRVFAYDGEPLSIAARLYQGQTTNFRTPGGGFAPVYVLPS